MLQIHPKNDYCLTDNINNLLNFNYPFNIKDIHSA
jgi:hypothetical protein